uniref:Misexpression suppressor of ras n=1 Tax=Lutzomyia longipalpis TaxID=7200 RepID=A0A1B0CKU4_LUTLO
MEKKPRTFERIPVFIVEDHNDVLEFIYRCLGSRHLPFEGNTLVHFDAHPDLTVPMKLPTEVVFDREKLLSSLSIENWIIPMCFAGHVGKIFWIRQEWAQQIPSGRHDFTIGASPCGHIRVDSELEYFISEGSFLPKERLRDSRSVEFHVGTPQEILACDTRPQNFILDIDLDYFSTHNPFLKLHSEVNLHERLRPIYSYKLDRNDLMGTVAKRLEQLDFLERIFTHLQEKRNLEGFEEKDHPLYEMIESLHRDIEDATESPIDWEIVHAAGCTLDSTPLPHHEATEDELSSSLEIFKDFLKKFPTPTIITMSRSSEDDYCPSNQVDAIEKAVLDILRDIYGNSLTDKPQFFYKDNKD